MFLEGIIVNKLKKQNLSITDFVIRFIILSIPIGIQALIVNLGLIASARYVDLERFSTIHYALTSLMLVIFIILQYINGFKIILSPEEEKG